MSIQPVYKELDPVMEGNHKESDEKNHASGALKKNPAQLRQITNSGRMVKMNELDPAHILIVDDDEAFGQMLKNVITKWSGFDCTYVQSAKEALKIMAERSFDVVITDIKMPETNGIELTRIIKKKYDADVIVITAFYEDFTYEAAIENGANDFLEKPVRHTELLLRMKRVLKERTMLNKRKQAEEERKVTLERLRKALGATVRALVVTSEIRDPYTAGHQRRVADLARSIGEKLSLSDDQIDGIRMASTIHDLGKISVPAEILSKPAKLDDIEFALIKRHSLSGYDILKDIDFPWPVARMVLEHHERLDGSGYPNGLTVDNILLESRVIAVADVVEAIASHRPYRAGLGIDVALDEIEKNKGILYDREVVDACLKLFRENGYELTS
ncbi:MAG: response regulator [Desulfobacterales bacterium]|nr:response regulator [Desulfobacterales bacterium]